jgi:hypothetical protein
MGKNVEPTRVDYGSRELDEELAGVLTAISIVSRRLANKLASLAKREEASKGGTINGQDE